MSYLHDENGRRKYLTAQERWDFLKASERLPTDVQTFCATLAYTGARISEVLELTPARVDIAQGLIVIECLKKRRRGVNRLVPIPETLIRKLDSIHNVQAKQKSSTASEERIWPWCRTVAWSNVKLAMASAGVNGPHATPKGLRHAFGVSAIQNGLPLNLVKRWLGHSRLATTEIYADAVGTEEREIAQRFWASGFKEGYSETNHASRTTANS